MPPFLQLATEIGCRPKIVTLLSEHGNSRKMPINAYCRGRFLRSSRRKTRRRRLRIFCRDLVNESASSCEYILAALEFLSPALSLKRIHESGSYVLQLLVMLLP